MSSTLNEQEGKKIVQDTVNEWSKVYINQVFFIEQVGNIWQYEVEFSKPKNIKPIPEGTVKVYFSIIEGFEEDFDVEFNFENESLKHRKGNTMRANMYESWINRVLEKKLMVKSVLHLGTEFEHSRFVDQSGKTVDPFVAAFDIMKVKDLGAQKRQSQKINVDSPRFISTLKRALEEMFQATDKAGTGMLTYTEFRDSFRTLTYGLNDNDINMLIALADENKAEKINWQLFIPIGIQAIRTFYTRNLAKKNQPKVHHTQDSLKLIYGKEISFCYKILSQCFEEADFLQSNNGHITLNQFKEIVRETTLLTPKEKNLLIRLQKSETIKYQEFPDMLYNVRYEIAVSEMMDYNMTDIAMFIRQEFAREDKDGSGQININQCNEALKRCKQIQLTPFQIQVMLGSSNCNGEGMVGYKDYAQVCQEFIDQNYRFESQIKKNELFEIHKSEIKEQHQGAEELDKFELFRLFKKFDRNQNGTLDFSEYTQCLGDCTSLGLSKEEIITTAMSADLEGDGEIDFQEFMKYFQTIVNTIYFYSQLNSFYTNWRQGEDERLLEESTDNKPAELSTVGAAVIDTGKAKKNQDYNASSFQQNQSTVIGSSSMFQQS